MKQQYEPLVFEKDLQYIFKSATEAFESLNGGRLFLTGGTGFFGKWLLESLLWAKWEGLLDIEITVLTRSLKKFKDEFPSLGNNSGVQFIEGDIRDFEFPKDKFTHIIHAATEASVSLNQNQPALMFDVITRGTARVLDLAEACGCQRLLLTSSGAVYGRQPSELTHIPESFLGAPDSLSPMSAYGEGKRVSEWMSVVKSQNISMEVVVARCFAFMGPFLPLEGSFAIGNFIKNGLDNETIVIQGDGTPMRSYLYAADLVVWLLTLLVKGKDGEAYNVGSDQGLSIKQLASCVAEAFGGQVNVKVIKTPQPEAAVARYVPNVDKAKNSLGLQVGRGFDEALKLTIDWHHRQSNGSF